MPRVSPASSVSLDVGVTTIKIDYHRPGVKGRAIWGGLVPYGQVWRLGANNATALSFNTPVKIAGTEVAAGTYALFALPAADRWTFILNKQADLWGAFQHDPKLDVLRIEAVPAAAPMTEWMQFTLSPAGEGKAEVALSWEKLRVGFIVEVDVRKAVWAGIDAALLENAKDADTLLAAARYAVETGERREEALAWIDAGIALKESYRQYEIKGDLLRAAGRLKEAGAMLDKALELGAKAGVSKEALEALQKKRTQWLGGS
jgi:tetratricopeptide (TPR) repeat protein